MYKTRWILITASLIVLFPSICGHEHNCIFTLGVLSLPRALLALYSSLPGLIHFPY